MTGRIARYAAALALVAPIAACKHNVYPDFKPPLVCQTKSRIRSSISDGKEGI